MRPESKIRAEAIGAALTIAIVLAPSPIWLKFILGSIAVICLVVAVFPSLAIRAQRLWTKPTNDENEAELSALQRQLAELRDGQRETHMVLVDIWAQLSGLVVPAPAPISVSATQTAGWESLAGLSTLTGIGSLAGTAAGVAAGVGATVSAGDVGVGTEKAKVEKLLLAAPLLNYETEIALRKELSRVSGKVSFTAVEGADESVGDMNRLATVFLKSKWAVAGTRTGRFQEPIVDIIIQAASEDAAYAGFVQGALKSVGIEAKGAIVPAMPQDQIEILVGNVTAKPSPSRR